MKQNKLIKTILILAVILVIGSWIIPASIFSNGTFSKVGHEPFGILDILLAPFWFFNWEMAKNQLLTDGTTLIAYSYTGILLLVFVVGIFYKILNKIGAYRNLIDSIVKKFEEKENQFFFITSLLFFLFSSFIGVRMLAFILIPFFVEILSKIKLSKLKIFLSTFGATLLGSIVSVTGSDVAGITNIMYDISLKDNLILKLGLLIFIFIFFIIYVLREKEPIIEEEKIEKSPKVKNEKSALPLILLTSIFFLIFLVCSYNWYYVFKTTAVYDVYEDLVSKTILSYPLGMNLFGMMEPFGYWSGFTISALLVLLAGLLCFTYSISLEEVVEAIKEGSKKMLRPAIYIVVSMIPMIMLTKIGGATNFLTAIIGFIYEHVTKLAVPFVSLATAIFGIFVGDFYAVSSVLNGVISSSYDGSIGLIAILMMQITHGLVCLAAPTSIFLVTGLGYLNIPYQKWLAYIWKLIAVLFAISFGLLLIMNII